MNAAKDSGYFNKTEEKLTDVIFLLDIGANNDTPTVYAFFPKEVYLPPKKYLSYAHIGQHGGCSIVYARKCKKATPEQYADLKNELESIGYNLNIIKSI